MVKKIIICIVCIINFKCSYVKLQQSYYSNYTNILNNNKDTTSINFRNAYVSLDPFLTNEYSKSAGKQINCFRYFFYTTII